MENDDLFKVMSGIFSNTWLKIFGILFLGTFFICFGLSFITELTFLETVKYTLFLFFLTLGISIIVCIPDKNICEGFIKRNTETDNYDETYYEKDITFHKKDI